MEDIPKYTNSEPLLQIGEVKLQHHDCGKLAVLIFMLERLPGFVVGRKSCELHAPQT
jgi:hypothetical protein